MHPIVSKNLVFYPYFLLNDRLSLKLKPNFDEAQWLTSDDIYERQWRRLKRIISYSYENVPFYRRAFEKNKIHPDDIRSRDDLLQIPILTKEDIQRNYVALKAPTGAARGIQRQTSGSSGSPLKLEKDSESIGAMNAVMFRNYGWFGVDLGQKEARYWGSPMSLFGGLKTKLKDFLLNRVRFSPFDVSVSACLSFVAKLRRFRPAYVYGYAQTIYRFSNYILESGIDLSDLGLQVVIVTGEMISEDQIATVRKAFQCPVSNEYGCTEVGIIAMTCPDNGMHIMAENIFVEFVNNGRHSKPGEEGEIVISELYGSLMPLIRYQVGDIAIYGESRCTCGRGLPLLSGIKGRNDEFILCPDGKQIDPIVFEYILTEVPKRLGKITQFRITQEKGYRLFIEAVYEGANREGMARMVVERLRNAAGDGFVIDYETVDYIRAEASGKLRCFVSKIKD